MKRADYLYEARKCVCQDRNNQYGEPEDNFAIIAEFWSTYLNTEISPMDVGVMMNLFKVGRIRSGATEDSFVDAIGYMACAGEIFSKEAIYEETQEKQ